MPSKLTQLKRMSLVVADTGDWEAIRTFAPVDCTTNPTLILRAAQLDSCAELVAEAIHWGQHQSATIEATTDRLVVNFAVSLCALVPGRVSVEVDADLSFDTQGMVEKACSLIAQIEARGVTRERILIKLATTWEGICAAQQLQQAHIDCNMTLLFSLPQAIACAQVGAFLISPFVGRILDWYVAREGRNFAPQEDPGVLSVREIYAYYHQHGIPTQIMAASFRTTGQIEALAGCDRLTISPPLLKILSEDEGELTRQLHPTSQTPPIPLYGPLDEKTFRYKFNESAVAVEKLSEGIRIFAKDLYLLRDLVKARVT